MNPYVAAARGFVNEVIKPEETREKLLKALKALRNKSADAPGKKTWEYSIIKLPSKNY